MTVSPRRCAIVGTGGVAHLHAQALLRRPDVELVAVADVDPGRLAAFAARYGVAETHADLDALLARATPDLVHLCTPPAGHAEQAIRCLRTGADVLCEKPPCRSLAEYDRIAEVERETGRHFITVVQQRYGSSARHVRRLVRDGELGRPLLAVCHTLWHRDADYYAVDWRGRWATEGGGTTFGHGIHQIDLLAHLLGDWVEVTAVADRLDRAIETEDVSMAHVRFAGGALASVVNSVLSRRQESYVRVDLTAATVELRHLYGYSAADWRTEPPIVFPEPDVPSSHDALLDDVLADLAAGRRPAPTGASVRRTLEIVTAIYAAAATGRPVRPTDLSPDHPHYHRLDGQHRPGS